MYQQCRHIMPNGVRCDSPALSGKTYCYFHTRLHRLAIEQRPDQEAPLRFPVLEDRSAIQIAVAQVLNALASPKSDVRRVGLLLYGLQIASQNVPHNPFILQTNAVHSLTQSPEGDDLAPEKFDCDIDDDCSTCEIRDNCPNDGPYEDDEEDDED